MSRTTGHMRVLPSPDAPTQPLAPTTVNDAIDDSLGFSLLVFDEHFTFLAAAGGALRANGVDPAELIGASAADVFPAWAWARAEEPFRAALAGRTSTTLMTDGSTWFSMTTQPIPGDTPKAVAISTTIAGATAAVQWPELPQLTDALAQVAGLGEQAFFEVAFASAAVGMAVVDFSGRWLRVNDALCTFLGRTATELQGKNFSELTDSASISAEEIAPLVAGDVASITTERRYRHKAGHWVTALLSVCVARDQSGAAQVFLSQMVDITAQKATEAQLQSLASKDGLTGLANRRAIEAVLTELVATGRGAVLLVDLDGFKVTNDGFGHSAGDTVLRAVADRLRDCTAPGDTVGRVGGDEFVVVLPQADAAEAAAVASELCEWIASTQVTLGPSTAISPSASIGAALVDDEAESSALLLAADIAMYDAKQRGGNQAVVYGGELAAHHRASNDMRWLAQLRRALTEHRFELHAQPIVDLATGKPVKYEMLLRLRGDDGELIYPGAFMPAAERLKLMRELDEWVVAEAATAAAAYPGVPLSINLSGSSVGDPSLPGRIQDLVFATQCDPTQLIFEITETEAIANMDQAAKLVEQISALGCKFALDDFGAGYASFSHVKRLAVDFVKIDGQFIRELPKTPDDQLIVSAIHAVATGMGRQVVAEMIEDEATADLLRAMGVEFGQGYHFARPAPIDDVLADQRKL